MVASFTQSINILILLFSYLLAATAGDILYGVCYQLYVNIALLIHDTFYFLRHFLHRNAHETNSPQIIISIPNEPTNLEDYGFNTSLPNHVHCIWVNSNEYAYSVSSIDLQTLQHNFINSTHVQESSLYQPSIQCNHQRIHFSHTRYF